MKRFILTALSILLALQAVAQDWRELRKQEFLDNFPYKYEVRLGWSGYPILEDRFIISRHRAGDITHTLRFVQDLHCHAGNVIDYRIIRHFSFLHSCRED